MIMHIFHMYNSKHPHIRDDDPGPSVKKDLSKTFYFRDVLKLQLKEH